MKSFFALIPLLFVFTQLNANDTLYFQLSNLWNSAKHPEGRYLRKAVQTADSGWLTLDYTRSNMLVARGYYTDTSFKTKLHCHYYFNEEKSFLEQVRWYKDGRLNGLNTGFAENGDTLWVQVFAHNELKSTRNYRGTRTKYPEFERVETQAEFPGGQAAWGQFLIENLRYPKEAFQKNIQGTVVVKFIIDKDGNITEVEIAERVHPLLDAEALRLIKSSPPWRAARSNGRNVKSYMKQPIIFNVL